MNHIRITSASNPIIKELRSLADKKGRLQEKALLLEGLRLVEDAADFGADIRYFVVSDNYLGRNESLLSRFPHHRVILLPDDLFRRVGGTENPQGIIAVVELPTHDQAGILSQVNRIIVLEGLQDPGNVGTIIRTADACGFDAILLSKDCVDPYNPKVIRSTMGSLFHLPVLICEDIYQTLEALKKRSIQIIAAHPREAMPCWEADLSKDIALVIGNEGNGLTECMLNLSDKKVMIPMCGRTESLNASTAAAMLLYEGMRQRHQR